MGLLVLFFPQQPEPPQPGYVNLSLAELDLWPALNATGPADAIWWTAQDIFDWFDECAKTLARKAGVFVDYDQTLATVSNQGPYALPAYFIDAIQADVGGIVLRPRNVQELEALDATWPATAGNPSAFLLDTQGLIQLTLYPAPTTGAVPIGVLMREEPAAVSPTNAIVFAPPVLREYFTFYAIAEARSEESHAAMPEVSKWLRSVLDMMDQAITGLWK